MTYTNKQGAIMDRNTKLKLGATIFYVSVAILAGLLAIHTYSIRSIAPDYLVTSTVKSMTYAECKNDPTVRFQASQYKDQYKNVSFDMILHNLCDKY